MPTISINKFDNGTADDVRTHNINQNEESLNFNIFDKPNYLQPYPDLATETIEGGLTITDYNISDVLYDVSGVNFLALGKSSSGSSIAKMFQKSAIGDAWELEVADAGSIVQYGTLVAHKGLAYFLNSDKFMEVTNITTITERGNYTGSGSIAKPFVHPKNDYLYGATGYILFRWTGAAFAEYNGIIPSDLYVTSLTDYGTYLAVACRPSSGLGNSYIFLINPADITLNTAEAISTVINLGEGNCKVLENIEETLVAVMDSNDITGVTLNNRLLVKTWNGSLTTQKEISINSNFALTQLKQKSKNRLFFTLLYSQGAGDDAIYSFGKNKEGLWTLSKDRYLNNGSTTYVTIRAFTIIGDVMWIGFRASSGSDGLFYRTSVAGAFTNTSKYTTTINPSMPLDDRYKHKQLDAVQISYTGASTGTTVLKYSVDGSTMTTIISDTNSTGEKTTEATMENDGSALLSGKEFQFRIECTGGTKIKEIKYKYSILSSQL